MTVVLALLASVCAIGSPAPATAADEPVSQAAELPFYGAPVYAHPNDPIPVQDVQIGPNAQAIGEHDFVLNIRGNPANGSPRGDLGRCVDAVHPDFPDETALHPDWGSGGYCNNNGGAQNLDVQIIPTDMPGATGRYLQGKVYMEGGCLDELQQVPNGLVRGCLVDEDHSPSITILVTGGYITPGCYIDRLVNTTWPPVPCPVQRVTTTVTRTYHPSDLNRPPVAQFAYSRSGTKPGLITTTNDSFDLDPGDVLRYAWDFGDGSASNSIAPNHTYGLPGSYTLKLTATDSEDATDSAFQLVEIPAPTLGVGITLPGRDNASIEPKETFTARVTVSASRNEDSVATVGALSELAPVEELLEVPNNFEILETAEVTEAMSLDPGASRAFDVELKAVGSGRFRLSSTWQGRDAAGRAVEGEGELNGQVGGLTVTITQNPEKLVIGEDNDGDGDVDESDSLVTYEVRVTNETDETITDVKAVDLGDPLQLTPASEDREINLEPLDPRPIARFGTIEAGETSPPLGTPPLGTPPMEFDFNATERTYGTVAMTVVGNAGGKTITGQGETEIAIGSDTLVEARFAVEDRTYVSGQPVRLTGSLENISEVKSDTGAILEEGKTVGVVVYPKLSGNAASGQIYPASFGGATPLSPQAIKLEPKQTVDIRGIIATAENIVPTWAQVEYSVGVFIWNEEGSESERGSPTAAEIIEDSEEGFSATHKVELAAGQIIPDEWLTCPHDLGFFAYTSCRFTAGVQKKTVALAHMAQMIGQGLLWISPIPDPKFAAARFEILQNFFEMLKGDETARARFVQEVHIDLDAIAQVTKDSVYGAAGAVGNIIPALAKFINRMDTVLSTGDLKLIAGEILGILGENFDMAIEAIVMARSMALAMKATSSADNVMGDLFEKSLQRQSDELAGKIDDVLNTGGDLTRSSVLRAGVDVVNHPRVWRDAFGARAEDIAGLLRVAREEGVIIAMRSRAPRAADLLERGLATFKPGGVSIKTVNDIDIKFLGYKQDWEAVAVLVEPPVPWVPRGSQRDELIEAFLNRDTRLTGPGEFSRSQRAAVKARLELRMDEWPKQVNKFKQYLDEGIDARFAPEKNGLPESHLYDDVPKRKARVYQDDIAAAGEVPTRRAFRLKMQDRAGGPYLDITGDIDLIGIFGLDGKPLTDLAKRARIYQQLQRLIGMQHGESFTFGIEKLREEFLSCCTEFGERMLAAMPDNSLRATWFADEKSVIKGGINTGLATGDAGQFAYLAGLGGEVISKARAVKPYELPDVLTKIAVANETSEFLVGQVKQNIVQALSDKAYSDNFRRDKLGAKVRPDGKGGFETYRDPNDEPESPTPDQRDAQAAPAASGMSVSPTGSAVLRSIVDVATVRLNAAGDPVISDPGGEGIDPAVLSEISDELAVLGDSPTDLVGAAGGYWVPTTPEELVALGDPDLLELAPTTFTRDDVLPGAESVSVFTSAQVGMADDGPFFAPGDTVVLDPGGPTEELATVASMDPMTFEQPLSNGHHAATMVLLFEAADDDPGSGGGDTGTSGTDSGIGTSGTDGDDTDGDAPAKAGSDCPTLPVLVTEDNREGAAIAWFVCRMHLVGGPWQGQVHLVLLPRGWFPCPQPAERRWYHPGSEFGGWLLENHCGYRPTIGWAWFGRWFAWDPPQSNWFWELVWADSRDR